MKLESPGSTAQLADVLHGEPLLFREREDVKFGIRSYVIGQGGREDRAVTALATCGAEPHPPILLADAGMGTSQVVRLEEIVLQPLWGSQTKPSSYVSGYSPGTTLVVGKKVFILVSVHVALSLFLDVETGQLAPQLPTGAPVILASGWRVSRIRQDGLEPLFHYPQPDPKSFSFA